MIITTATPTATLKNITCVIEPSTLREYKGEYKLILSSDLLPLAGATYYSISIPLYNQRTFDLCVFLIFLKPYNTSL